MDSASAEKAVLKAVHSSGVRAGSESNLMFVSAVLVICAVGVVWLFTTMKSDNEKTAQTLEAKVQLRDEMLNDVAARDARVAQQRSGPVCV